TGKPSIYKMRRADLIKEIEEERQKNKTITLPEDQLNTDTKQDLDVVSKKNRELTAERDSLLQQLQQERSKNEELHKKCKGIQDLMHDLTEHLDQIYTENTCAICLAPWEAVGDHRVVSLKCGHVFGKECIQQHMMYSSKCPYCNKVSVFADLRDIFGRLILPIGRPLR
ncbi:hypothetical protein KR054_006265, partial [Drosophila jambulina]